MQIDAEKNVYTSGGLSLISSDSNIFDTKSSKKIPLALIDNRPLTLASFTNFIHDTTSEYSINTFNNPEELLNQAKNEINTVKIIVFNIGYKRVGDKDIDDVILKLKVYLPEAHLVLIADCEDNHCIIQAINLGVQGYITTSLMPSVVIAALKLVLEGGIFAPLQPFIEKIEQKHNENTGNFHLPDTLYFTPRQLEVLERVKRGEPNKIIAHKLGMQECTVKVHIRDIMKKLDATNRTQLVYKIEHIKLESEPD